MGRRKQRMSMHEAMEMVPDDLPDGAFWAMAHEFAGLDYGDGFDEFVSDATGVPQEASYRKPEFKIGKRLRNKIEVLGFEVHQHDAYHFTVRRSGKVVADWWPHKRQYRIAGITTKGDEHKFVAALGALPKAETT